MNHYLFYRQHSGCRVLQPHRGTQQARWANLSHIRNQANVEAVFQPWNLWERSWPKQLNSAVAVLHKLCVCVIIGRFLFILFISIYIAIYFHQNNVHVWHKRNITYWSPPKGFVVQTRVWSCRQLFATGLLDPYPLKAAAASQWCNAVEGNRIGRKGRSDNVQSPYP